MDGMASTRRVDPEVEPRSQRDSRIARTDPREADLDPDRAHDARLEIREAIDVVDDRERGNVVEERVDGEVAAKGVLFRRAERVVVMNQGVAKADRNACRRSSAAGDSAARVVNRRRHAVLHDLFTRGDLSPERGHLDDLRPELDVRQTKPPPDDPAVAEELLDLVRVRRGADVKILGAPADQEIADAAADEVGLVYSTRGGDAAPSRVGVDVAARDGMLGAATPSDQPSDVIASNTSRTGAKWLIFTTS